MLRDSVNPVMECESLLSSQSISATRPTQAYQPQPPTTLINLAIMRNMDLHMGGKDSLAEKGISSTAVRRKLSSPDTQSNSANLSHSQTRQHHHHHHTSSQSNTIGHYELKRTLGKGNFSTVKLAHHKITHLSVAVKIVKFSVLSDDNLMKINREIDVLKKLGRHKHIVRLYQVIKTKRYFFLVTEFCTNGELYDYLVDKGRLDEQQSCKYFLQILSAVEYLHDHNIVHRDLKAENLLLTDNYETVKIADFGFANYFKKDKLLSTWCGSPPYAAPELFKGLLYTGPPVDIWSMGVILYVLVCGSLPFDGHSLIHLKSRVTSGKFRIPFFMTTECESLIRGMLRLDPERRFNIKQIKAHCWIKKYDVSEQKEVQTEHVDITDVGDINNNHNLMKDVSSRGKSLETENDKTTTSELPRNADGLLTSFTNDPKLSRTNLDLGPRASPSNIQHLVDTEIVNAVSNMSIDSTNSHSISQGMDITNATFSNHSGCASSLSSSRYSAAPRADSSCTNHGRQFSKESSIDDQIIDFMVENLKVAENQSLIRQSIANDKYDDLHAIYRILKDQPDMVQESKFRIPSLPLISPSREDTNKKPSITTGFFNFAGVHDQSQASRDKDENSRTGFSGESERKNQINARDAENRSAFVDLSPRSSDRDNFPRQDVCKKKSDECSWNVPPQLFLTPPIEGRTQVTKVADVSTNNNQDSSTATKNVIARHSFDSAINTYLSTDASTLWDLNRDCAWDSSILDSQGTSLTPSTPVKLGDSIISPELAGNNIPLDGTFRLNQNLATITTNLPQIGAQDGTTNIINHNLLLAQLNASGGNAAMTQSGLITQNEPIEQRFQQAIPLKFTPNNLVNQNYNVLNTLAMQNTLKIPGVPNINLLDPDGTTSGLERRASDGQASYSSLTSTNDDDRAQEQCRTIAKQREQENRERTYQRPHEITGNARFSSSSNQILSSEMSDQHGHLLDNIFQKNSSHLINVLEHNQNQCTINGVDLSPMNSRHQNDSEYNLDSNDKRSQAIRPLDLSKKLSCHNDKVTVDDKRDGLKRVNNQRSKTTTSDMTECSPNPSKADTTSIDSSFVDSPVVASNSGIPLSHAVKRAKKLH